MREKKLHYNETQKLRQNYNDYKLMNNKVKQMNDLTSNDDLYLDRDRY